MCTWHACRFDLSAVKIELQTISFKLFYTLFILYFFHFLPFTMRTAQLLMFNLFLLFFLLLTRICVELNLFWLVVFSVY